jgi:Urocanase Rossmann-like domain
MSLPDLSLVHDRYLSLSRTARRSFAGTLAGRLLLRLVFDADGVAAAIAASVAGAATLCVDADAEALRQGLRAGFCDFVVGNLDEALRILKNEIRRGLPVCVCLSASPVACSEAMAERGVQPDLLSLAGAVSPAAQRMLERGALRLAAYPEPDPVTSLLHWSVAADPARSMPRIAALAVESLDSKEGSAPARRRWLEASPRYLGRAFGWQQCVRMTPIEAARFIERLRAEFPSAAVERDGKSAL